MFDTKASSPLTLFIPLTYQFSANCCSKAPKSGESGESLLRWYVRSSAKSAGRDDITDYAKAARAQICALLGSGATQETGHARIAYNLMYGPFGFFTAVQDPPISSTSVPGINCASLPRIDPGFDLYWKSSTRFQCVVCRDISGTKS